MRYDHDPQAVLDYKWDWSWWLRPGETITSFTLAVENNDGGLDINAGAITDGGTSVTAYIGHGTLNRTYQITNHVVSSQGREEDLVLTLFIRDPVRTTGVCDWPVDYAECGPCDVLASMPASGVQRYEDMATEFLWRWTDRQFGMCEGTIRPCRQDCFEGMSTYYGGSGLGLPGRSPFQPTLIRGNWFNVGCGGGCGDDCGCTWGRSLKFETPVYEVSKVEIDGVILDPSAYRVDNYRLLVRQDGQQWPYCQDLSKPLGQPDTWAVTVRTGSPVPIGGRVAAGKLACELAKAACGSKGCELPSRVQSVTRQGVSISMMLDTFEDVDKGRTGIWLIDSWVSSVTKPDIGFSIASPDYKGVGRRRTF